MSRLDADVIVVGAGPAGSATAFWLSRHGLDVLLLDKARFPREKACGEYLSPGVRDALERLGAIERVEALGHCLHPGMRIQTPHEQFLVGYDQGAAPRFAIGVQRPAFDQALLRHATASGVRVLEQTAVAGPLVHEGRVAGVRLRGDESGRALTARFVVAADGLHSTIARSLGLERRLFWPHRLGLVARYRLPPGRRLEATMHVGAAHYCGLNPVGDDLVNVGIVGRLGAKRPGESTIALFERSIAELPGARRSLDGAIRVTPIRGMGPLARQVRRVAGPGYLLVGDSAGFFDPFTGEGIYRALRGAELASEAVATAIERDQLIPAGYVDARKRAFAEKERLCVLIQLLLVSGRAFDYTLRRLRGRNSLATSFSGVLGDYIPAGLGAGPSQLLQLLKP